MKIWLIVSLVLVAFAGRLLPHPDNFTPALAIALFAGAMLPSRMAFIVPILAMAASDVALGYAIDWTTPVVYGSLMAAVGIGLWLGTRRTWARTLLAALGGSVMFFVVTNFAAWLGPLHLYPQTFDGLVQCYVLALPFFRQSLLGDLVWTAALFGIYDLTAAWLEARRHAVA
jgi:hypothetical protein